MIDRRQRNAALLVAACFFMEMFDGTIVTTSVPRMARALQVSTGSLTLVITAYMVTIAALIPMSGWLTARFGARRVFLAAIVLFTLASLGCALSSSLGELVAMRVLQGMGGAMMVPVGRLVVLGRAPKVDLMRLTAYLVWPALMAPVVAPLAGGLITTYASWHWLFLINIPLGAAALGVALRIIRPPDDPQPGRFDWAGMFLTSCGLAGIAITATLLSDSRNDWPLTIAAAIFSIVVLALAALHLLRARAPLVDLRTLRIPTLRTAATGMNIYAAVINAMPYLVPLKFEEQFGWSAVKSGALVLFIFVGNIGIKPATTFLYSRFGFRRMLIASTGIQTLAMIAMALTSAGTPLVLIAAVLLISGIVRSTAATGYSTIAFTDVPPKDMRHANTVLSTAQQLGGGFGAAGGAIGLRLGHSIGRIFSRHPTVHTSFLVAFLAVGALACLVMLDAMRLHPDAGNVLRRGRDVKPSRRPASQAR